ncbi:hypothetical protein BUALT_Bualt16G0057900 [Buddleja alternifolia]|uniref:Uncharacterized protein n=1 Tax=Buddleja alternifolia TaxID=168488 RepID=A0AAV6WB67_9LAMI|nr:hypothetical protein BUALT_Bualt16G0057900 [Buddleja alternifolia]
MGRAPCCDKSKVKRGPWSPEEDNTLKNYIHQYGTGGNWILLPQKAGLKRCGKSCRLRWLNYLRPNIKHGGFTEEEDNIILTLYHNIGSRWSVIASHLPERTDNDVKNYWNTKLKKKLLFSAPPTNSSSSSSTTTNFNYAPSSTASVETIYTVNPIFSVNNTMLPYLPVEDINSDQAILRAQTPLPGLTEITENGENIAYDFGTFSSQEAVTSLRISPSFSVDDNASVSASWSTGLMPYDDLNAFQFLDKFTDEMNHSDLDYYSANYSNLLAVNNSNTEQQQSFPQSRLIM